MDKIGEYIPLIIIALSFIYSFARKAGKKGQQEETVNTTLPNEIFGQSIPKPRVKIKPQPHPVVTDTGKITGFKRTEQTLTVVDEPVEEERLAFDFSDTDELKKGIIFAEIFNRKY